MMATLFPQYSLHYIHITIRYAEKDNEIQIGYMLNDYIFIRKHLYTFTIKRNIFQFNKLYILRFSSHPNFIYLPLYYSIAVKPVIWHLSRELLHLQSV